jgi:hypothetical protein
MSPADTILAILGSSDSVNREKLLDEAHAVATKP